MLTVVILEAVPVPSENVHLAIPQMQVLRGDPREIQVPAMAEVRTWVLLVQIGRWDRVPLECTRSDEDPGDFQVHLSPGENQVRLFHREKPAAGRYEFAHLLEVGLIWRQTLPVPGLPSLTSNAHRRRHRPKVGPRAGETL